jgi:hypothetical protein
MAQTPATAPPICWKEEPAIFALRLFRSTILDSCLDRTETTGMLTSRKPSDFASQARTESVRFSCRKGPTVVLGALRNAQE